MFFIRDKWQIFKFLFFLWYWFKNVLNSRSGLNPGFWKEGRDKKYIFWLLVRSWTNLWMWLAVVSNVDRKTYGKNVPVSKIIGINELANAFARFYLIWQRLSAVLSFWKWVSLLYIWTKQINVFANRFIPMSSSYRN